MGKRLPYTPTSQIKNCLRMLSLRSRERNAAIKREKGRCQKCGRKQSKRKGKEVKIEIHHIKGVKWAEIIAYIREHLLCDPVFLEVHCKECHNKYHGGVDNE